MADKHKKGLGRGLGALITLNPEKTPPKMDPVPIPPPPVVTTDPVELTGERLIYIDPRKVAPNPKQPRKVFREEALEELAESIKRDGIQEPVIVRQAGGLYELVSGERRVRASVMAGLEKVPAICREITDDEMLKLGLIENLQREDLNPIELARAYQDLIDQFRWTQEQLADEVGKKRATVTNMLRLLNLPQDLQNYVTDGTLSMGHARALLALPTVEGQRAAARKIILHNLSVREAEKLAAPQEAKSPKRPERKDPNIAAIEDELRGLLSAKVSLKNSPKNRGKIEIEYYNLDDLERLLAYLRTRHE